MEPIQDQNAVGICEHCEGLVSFMDYAGGDSLNAQWMCGTCGKPLSHLSFGFNQGEGGAKKVRFVGPGKQWVSEIPDDTFMIGGITITPPTKPFGL